MAGIAAYLDPTPEAVQPVLRRMAWQLADRGPDGTELEVAGRVGLVHRWRSAPGRPPDRQPVVSPDGRLMLVLDGELPRRWELADELLGRGRQVPPGSDAALALAAWQEWGPAALDRLGGTFALAVVDTATGELVVARDPCGVRPMYLAADGSGRVAAASSVRAVLAAAVVPRRPDDVTVYRYLRFGVADDTGRTFYDRVSRLRAGELARISPDGTVSLERYSRLRYELEWLAADARPLDRRSRRRMSDALTEAVRAALPVNAPVGVLVHPAGRDLTGLVRATRAPHRAYRLTEAAGADEQRVAAGPAGWRADLVDFITCQEEPTTTLAAYLHWRMVREAATQVPLVLDGLAPGTGGRRPLVVAAAALWETLTDRLRGRTPPRGLLDPDFAAAHADERPPARPRAAAAALTEQLFGTPVPAWLRYVDRNRTRFPVQLRLPLLEPGLLRRWWGTAPVAAPGPPLPPVPLDVEATGDLPSGPGRPGRRPAQDWHRALHTAVAAAYADQPASAGYVDPDAVRRALERTARAASPVAAPLWWRLLNLEVWLRECVRRDPTATLSGAVPVPGPPRPGSAPQQLAT